MTLQKRELESLRLKAVKKRINKRIRKEIDFFSDIGDFC